MNSLTFEFLRTQNVLRCEDVFHALNDWSPTDWGCAMAGEAGEACNKIKKLRRLEGADAHQNTLEQREKLRREIGKELADLVIYADLTAARLGISLGDAVTQKFNDVSRERGSRITL